MEKFKESSARIVLFREFGILNSFTLENSFIYKKRIEVEEDVDSQEVTTTTDETKCIT